MKRTISLLLAVAMLLCLTACGQNAAEEVTFKPGKTDGNVYTSEFLGLQLELPSNFTFYTQEEINELNGVMGDMLDENLAAAVKDAQLIYDMCTADQSGNSVNINFENLNVTGVQVDSAAKYVELSKENVPAALESMGYTVSSCEVGSTTVAGKEYATLNIEATIGGFSFYETVACVKIGNYVGCITVGGFDQSKIDELLGAFTAL